MTSEQRLVVFVKAPTPGAVKTRLGPALSAEQAAQLYRHVVRETLHAVSAIPDIHLVVAYAADANFPDLSWLGVDCPMFLQRGQTLGERLIQAFRGAFEQRAKRVVALGSDAPEVSARWVAGAFNTLADYDAVVGPTTDGGYQLIGLNQLYPELFMDMPWSTPRLCGEAVKRLETLRLTYRLLEPVADLDTPDDLRRYVASHGDAPTETARYLSACLDARSR